MGTLCFVFVCNRAYFERFMYTCSLLVTRGNYHGDICLVIGDDLKDIPISQLDFIQKHGIIVQHFPDIQFSPEFLRVNNTLTKTDGRNITKRFQWHKLHLFHTFFKRWDYVLYLDCAMTIFADITPILEERREKTLVAHSDAFPTYEWRLRNQFDDTITDVFTILNKKYNLDTDYFQTGIMLYDTSLIEEGTFQELIQLMQEYPISTTNEQGILALYFTNIRPCWKPLRIEKDGMYLYDFCRRHPSHPHIILSRV
jgi:hypothetical protein